MTNDRPLTYNNQRYDGTYSNAPPEKREAWSALDEATNRPLEQKPEGNAQPARTNYDPKTQRR